MNCYRLMSVERVYLEQLLWSDLDISDLLCREEVVLAQRFEWCPLMRSIAASPLFKPLSDYAAWCCLGLTLGIVYTGAVSNLWSEVLWRRQLDRASIGAQRLECWQSREGFQMSYQLIYPAIKQYSGNKVGGVDQSASLFSSPGYGKIDLSNKAFWKQHMHLFGIH